MFMQKNKNGMRIVILFVMLVFNFGCATKNSVPAPEVKLVDVVFADATLFRTSIKVLTEVRNQHDSEIKVTGTSHELEINGVDLGKSYSDLELRLKPLQAKRVPVTFDLSNMTVLSNLQSMFSRGDVNYEIKSRFFVEGDFGKQTLEAEEQDTLLAVR